MQTPHPKERARFPGLVTVYQPPTWVYHHWALVLDPTKLPRLVRCGTVMVDGVYFGTDKLMHFTHVGYQYYEAYRRARAAGQDEAQATWAAVKLGTGNHPFLSEATWLGLMTTGVWSNADLAVNYVGLLFFRNLTEEVVVGGALRPPMLVRDGAYWRLNDHVQPGVDLFSPFVTDHWDEVLNPNLYGPGIASCVKTQVAERCTQVAAWYRDRHLRPRQVTDFARIAEELVTYCGADYGHRGDWADMVTYANVCLAPADDADTARELVADDAPDVFGRGALWWAAADRDVARVARLVDAGAPINAADIDDETPVHASARAGAADVITALAGGGAAMNARAVYGVTPLHLAVRENHADAARALLAAGAVVEVADDFGRTPLCDAVARGQLELARLLVAHGADPNRADRFGRTARDHATRAGHQPIIDWLDDTVLTAE